ncbi:MAG: EAL domain-containing response regulator [Ahrensia sp.]|nr:EAL domain-containing response regulator [Ahrensia sp.]
MRVLALDDDLIFLAVLESYMTMLGASHVDTTDDADVALHLIKSGCIDLLLLDLNMPRKDGMAFLREVSQSGFTGSVIIISGENNFILSSSGYIGKKLGVNICGTLRKPLNVEDLRKSFEQARTFAQTAPKKKAVSTETTMGSVRPTLQYQPQYDAKTGLMSGAEALLRGIDEKNALVGAFATLQQFPSDQDRIELTSQLFDIFCQDVSDLRGQGYTERFSFNIDAVCLEAPDFTSTLATTLKKYKLKADGLVIELTETHLPKNETWLLEVIARISMAGFEVSMDDFSTGAASFDLLRAGAFREVKLDSTLVQRSAHDVASAKFIANVIDVARTMDIRVIAEGIETAADKTRLEALGARHLQGYYFSRPTGKNNLPKPSVTYADQFSAAS